MLRPNSSPSLTLLFVSVINFVLLLFTSKFTMQSFPINSIELTLTLNNGFSLISKYSGLIPTKYLFLFNSFESIFV